jgi:hypothetical protein
MGFFSRNETNQGFFKHPKLDRINFSSPRKSFLYLLNDNCILLIMIRVKGNIDYMNLVFMRADD